MGQAVKPVQSGIRTAEFPVMYDDQEAGNDQ